MKLVDFHKWCDLCEYKDLKESAYPCDQCLGCPANEDSTKPLYFKDPNYSDYSEYIKNDIAAVKEAYDRINKEKDD